MFDLIAVAAVVAFFGATWGYVRFCAAIATSTAERSDGEP